MKDFAANAQEDKIHTLGREVLHLGQSKKSPHSMNTWKYRITIPNIIVTIPVMHKLKNKSPYLPKHKVYVLFTHYNRSILFSNPHLHLRIFPIYAASKPPPDPYIHTHALSGTAEADDWRLLSAVAAAADEMMLPPPFSGSAAIVSADVRRGFFRFRR